MFLILPNQKELAGDIEGDRNSGVKITVIAKEGRPQALAKSEL